MKSQSFTIGMCLLNLVLLLFIAARPGDQVVDKLTVREFELVDKNGANRVSIKTEDDGSVILRMKDSKGTIRVKMGADESGSGLVLLDADTNPGLQVLAKKEGGTLSLYSKEGKKREY
ncbi:hypothetical protein GXP67_20995 [Rhodocytophaga rosea]|uniref:Uncharacterized protein n=1 Tax=Rhodocytophaga rosea TaxID=2704465 RepID=A0A6C0GLP7_9BACT|nr:hypothetical protein [Rhodocytophaga rosea]QHT68948.1 hypothetical protein GXP67_20995 [Rhodocytophaga rosea]